MAPLCSGWERRHRRVLNGRVMWSDLGLGLVCSYSSMGDGFEGVGTGGRQAFHSEHDSSLASQIHGARDSLRASLWFIIRLRFIPSQCQAAAILSTWLYCWSGPGDCGFPAPWISGLNPRVSLTMELKNRSCFYSIREEAKDLGRVWINRNDPWRALWGAWGLTQKALSTRESRGEAFWQETKYPRWHLGRPGFPFLTCLQPLSPTSLLTPFLTPSPCLALCSVLIPRESFCSHQTNTGALEKTKELSNQSKSVQWRRGWGMVWSGKGRNEDMALGIWSDQPPSWATRSPFWITIPGHYCSRPKAIENALCDPMCEKDWNTKSLGGFNPDSMI